MQACWKYVWLVSQFTNGAAVLAGLSVGSPKQHEGHGAQVWQSVPYASGRTWSCCLFVRRVLPRKVFSEKFRRARRGEPSLNFLVAGYFVTKSLRLSPG